MLGSVEPRLWTPPLRPLTPATSYGFDVIEFADDQLAHPLRPWQKWLTIHAGELLPDGRPRFRIVLVLVARQNGKTEVLVVLSLYWQFVEVFPLIIGTSTKLDYAKESWVKAVNLAESSPELTPLRAARWKREANGEQESWTLEKSRYKISASNEEGGRSLTINRLIADELRQHHDYSAWGALEPAASPLDAQIWALSNAGDDRSIVLNELRDAALTYIETGQGDPRLGIFEWSAPKDADPLDAHALAMANPEYGRHLDPDVIHGAAARAVNKGGEALTSFKTERMCIHVKMLKPAIDPGAWARGLEPGTLRDTPSRVAMCLDLAPDSLHATLAAAAVLPDGRIRVDIVETWEGTACTDQLRRDLPTLLARIRPQVVGWLPAGPAAALAADLTQRKGRTGWPPAGIKVEPIRGEVPAICMGLDEQVTAGRIVHSGDRDLDDHIGDAERLNRGDAWVFSRRGEGHVDAAYAAAGAVHLARTMPQTIKPHLIVARDRSVSG